MDERLGIGITMGDPFGIGPEIVLKALTDPALYQRMVPVVFGDPEVLEASARRFGLALRMHPIDDRKEAEGRVGIIDVVATAPVGKPVNWGAVDAQAGHAAGSAIETAVAWARQGALDALNTAPISKEALREGGYRFPGHTEMLTELFSASGVFTMFVVGQLRVFFLTRHHPLRDAIELLTVDRVYAGIVRCLELLEELGINNPTLAVAALNPHAGEHGLLGREEQEVLEPAVARAVEEGHRVVGPVPADAVFYQGRDGRYSGVLSLYHDQGHIATKTLDFYGTVSVTLGLPVIRTSVDHGTAFDIAGKNQANPAGQRAALQVAVDLARIKRGRT